MDRPYHWNWIMDGDKNNNQFDNLRLICPNCHALTETYRGKNSRYAHIPSANEVKAGIKRCGSVIAYEREKKVSSITVGVGYPDPTGDSSGRVVELVYTRHLKCLGETHVGSNPISPTKPQSRNAAKAVS